MATLVLISPAKTMQEVDTEPKAKRQPLYLEEALEITLKLESQDFETLKALWKTSDSLTQENMERLSGLSTRMALDTHAKTAAVMSYVGIQYQHLAPSVMTDVELNWLDEHLRILSGVYGVLKPFDAILPYRLEMQAKTKELLGQNLYDFWADKVVAALLGELTDKDEKLNIINCASVEYSKVVKKGLKSQRKELQDKVNFLDVRFCIPKEKTWSDPSEIHWIERSTEAKAARGSFVRWLAEEQIEDIQDMKNFRERNYLFVEKTAKELVFYKDLSSC